MALLVFSYLFILRCYSNPTSVELHWTGAFEGSSTNWASVPRQLLKVTYSGSPYPNTGLAIKINSYDANLHYLTWAELSFLFWRKFRASSSWATQEDLRLIRWRQPAWWWRWSSPPASCSRAGGRWDLGRPRARSSTCWWWCPWESRTCRRWRCCSRCLSAGSWVDSPEPESKDVSSALVA